MLNIDFTGFSLSITSLSNCCKFAISALVQNAQAKDTWRLAVPGDGYKY